MTTAEYVENALSPAKVVAVEIIAADKIAQVVVPDYQLSLAIGKEGTECPAGGEINRLENRYQKRISGG